MSKHNLIIYSLLLGGCADKRLGGFVDNVRGNRRDVFSSYGAERWAQT